jgi:hypothetical protein
LTKRCSFSLNGINPNRTADVFKLLLAQVCDGHDQPAMKLFIDFMGNADATRISKGLQANSNVDAITIEVAIVFGDNISKVDAHAKLDWLHSRLFISREGLLEHQAALYGLNGAGELEQRSIACCLDQPSSLGFCRWDNDVGQRSPNGSQGSSLVGFDQAGRTYDIHSEDGGETAGGHLGRPPN